MKVDNKAKYKERARVQALNWAQGKSYHNNIDDECCPDFSCCHPECFIIDSTERWKKYHRYYGNKH